MKPTMNLRWHKHVTGKTWSTQWDEVYTLKLEQMWSDENGNEEWRTLPIFETQATNQQWLG